MIPARYAATRFPAKLMQTLGSKTVIRQSDCIGILPKHAMEPELQRGELICLPITSDVLRRKIAFYYRDHRPPSAPVSAVMREIERVCRA